MMLGPALVLAILVGTFHAALFVVVRGSGGGALPVIWLAAILGAWAGDAIAGRLAVDPLRIGDFHLVGASIVAWVGIGVGAVAAVLGPTGRRA